MQDQDNTQGMFISPIQTPLETSSICETTWPDIPIESDLETTIDSTSDGRFARISNVSSKTPFGLAFTAFDRDTGNEVLWRQIEMGKVDRVAFKDWMKELKNVIRLDCANIVNYLSSEERSNNEIVLISEMMTRGSFSEYLAGLKQPRLSVCQNWFRQILLGLQTLHERRITHGRLSFEHIFINGNTGEVKIGDLSLVKLEEIKSNRLTLHRPIDDIHQFGLLILEIALAQMLQPSKLKFVMNKHYDSTALDKKKIENLTLYIEEDSYRSLVMHCVNAEEVTALEILKHPFFAKTFKKNDVLKANNNRKRRKTEFIKQSNLQNTTIDICSNIFKAPNAKRIKVTLRVVNNESVFLIKFTYDIDTDTPEGVAEELKTQLNFPDTYITAFKTRLSQALHDYCREDKKEIVKAKVVDTSSHTDCTLTQNSECNTKGKQYQAKPQVDFNKEGGERRAVQPDTTFSDIQYTPRTGVEEDAEQKGKSKLLDEDSKASQ